MGRRAGIWLTAFGLFGVLYFGWAQHRADLATVAKDPQWPRGDPYPDARLSDLNEIFDARHPVKSADSIKLHGEFARVRATVFCFLFGFAMITGAGIKILVAARVVGEPRDSSPPRDPIALSTVE